MPQNQLDDAMVQIDDAMMRLDDAHSFRHSVCHANGLQVALLREKLAKEQQRARAAEAMLAAQHQMQQLLQGIVQAVLLARSSMQVHLLYEGVIHSYRTCSSCINSEGTISGQQICPQ